MALCGVPISVYIHKVIYICIYKDARVSKRVGDFEGRAGGWDRNRGTERMTLSSNTEATSFQQAIKRQSADVRRSLGCATSDQRSRLAAKAGELDFCRGDSLGAPGPMIYARQ